MARRLTVGEVARLTGSTVRTLHHYDRIGLLRPSAVSEAGYRLYAEADLLRLQQVLTLRYLGFPLKQIRDLLARPDFDLLAALHIQQQVVRDRIDELERIGAVLGDLVRRRETTGDWDWEAVIRASAEVGRGLAQREGQVEAYYMPEQMARFAALREAVSAEEIAAVEAGWTALLAEVRAAREIGLDPASAEAMALADRWQALTERTMAHYRHDSDLSSAIQANYDRGAFENHDRAPQAADFAFIQVVEAARSAR